MVSSPGNGRLTAPRLRNFLAAALPTLIAALLLVSPAQAQDLPPPPSLQGETFIAGYSAIEGTVEMEVGEIDVSASCSAAGKTSTITYSARGQAFGPYPGPYTETGTVEFTATEEITGGVSGIITSWSANFTVKSFQEDITMNADVNGTKSLLAGTVPATCVREPGVLELALEQESASATLAYEATITTSHNFDFPFACERFGYPVCPTRSFRDEGTASVSVRRFGICRRSSPSEKTCDQENMSFVENFTLSTGLLPLDAGAATGGGQLGDLTAPGHVTFAFEVRETNDPDRFRGGCIVIDLSSDTKVKCLTAENYGQIGNTATWFGTAEVNGVEQLYRITVQDNGEPNQGIDTFSISTETYQAVGNVQHGNVQLHKQALATP